MFDLEEMFRSVIVIGLAKVKFAVFFFATVYEVMLYWSTKHMNLSSGLNLY